jgi:glucose-6-phosphate 1-epimerase
MYLHGAHVTSWQPRGAEPVVFVSSETRWDDGRAIRGGVPICFPWFGGKANDPHAPAHGFVRTMAWQLESIEQAGDAVTVSMFIESNVETKRWWPADFRLVHRVTFGSELSLELMVRNTGGASLRFEEALHAYFQVGHIERALVQGLSAVQYLDKTDSNRKKTQEGPIVIASETDRVYLNTKDALTLEDQSLSRRIEIAKKNSSTTVVWNPWVEKAKSLSDFGDDEWTKMICVETCNVTEEFVVELAPGQQHTMQALVRVAGL